MAVWLHGFQSDTRFVVLALAAAGFVCAVFPMQDHVSLVFEHGRQLNSPMLQGDGAQVRFIRIEPGVLPDRDALAILIAEAIALRA